MVRHFREVQPPARTVSEALRVNRSRALLRCGIWALLDRRGGQPAVYGNPQECRELRAGSRDGHLIQPLQRSFALSLNSRCSGCKLTRPLFRLSGTHPRWGTRQH
jgi:hypothetical protein